jgi:hypothetical protein
MLLLTSMLLVSGCVTGPGSSSPAICDGTALLRQDLARALAVTPDDDALITGDKLLTALEAGCNG